MKLNRIVAGVLALTLAFAGCSGADPEPVAPPTTTTPELVDLATEDFIPMSYLVKRSMAGYTATALGGWFGECIGESLWGAWQSDGWRENNQQFYLFGPVDDPAIRITFGPISWSPEGSQWTYGKTVVVKQQQQEISGSAYLLDNSGNDDPLSFSQEETLTLSQTRSTTTDTEINVDIGVKTTGTIGGDNFGAKLETEVSASLGIKTDVAKAEEESKDTTTTRDIATDVDPGKVTLVTIDAPTVTSQTPFTMSAAWEPAWIEFEANPFNVRSGHDGCAAHLGWPRIGDRDCDTADVCKNHKFKIDWDDFLSLIGGYNTDFPHFDSDCCIVARPRC